MIIYYFFRQTNEIEKKKWAMFGGQDSPCQSRFHWIFFYLEFMFQEQTAFLNVQ